MTRRDQRERSFIFLLAAIVLGSAGLFVASMAMYFWAFHGALSLIPNDWSAFGGYAGGVLGPVFGFASLLALVLTLHFQRQGLQEARRATLENTRNALLFQLLALWMGDPLRVHRAKVYDYMISNFGEESIPIVFSEVDRDAKDVANSLREVCSFVSRLFTLGDRGFLERNTVGRVFEDVLPWLKIFRRLWVDQPQHAPIHPVGGDGGFIWYDEYTNGMIDWFPERGSLATSRSQEVADEPNGAEV